MLPTERKSEENFIVSALFEKGSILSLSKRLSINGSWYL